MTTLAAVFALLLALSAPTAACAFDHSHGAWHALVRQHVVWIDNGTASQVDYAGFKQDQAELDAYLVTLSAVTQAEFDGWRNPQQLAFLINAYNAFTVKLILSKYPNLRSIKDLGTIFKSPWKKEFFTLLGKKHHLDYIEHELIRAPGRYNDPRIHVAVVCASIGCPALRDEAFTADKLDQQLADNMQRFMADRSRNRYNARSGKLEVSKIFDWYGQDFSQGYGGFDSVQSVFGRYADALADKPQDRERIRAGQVPVVFLDYDWALNDGKL